jgi:hypothetical protein
MISGIFSIQIEKHKDSCISLLMYVLYVLLVFKPDTTEYISYMTLFGGPILYSVI